MTQLPADDESVEIELDLLLRAIAKRSGYDFRDYSLPSLKRRVSRALQIEGLNTLSALQERVLRDDAALQRFISCLSVRVTGMFRDPEVYRLLRQTVLPVLRTYPFIRVWHTGCSTGEEVYSTAILLHEEGILDRSRIYATDLSVDLLAKASRGVFPLESMLEYARAYRAAGGDRDFSLYYSADDRNAIFNDELRSRIVFAQHNLVSDDTFNEFHLIFCRNVMIYFNDELRDRVHGLLYESLVRLGVLVLGLRESLRFTPRYDRYEAIDESLRVYRRIV